MGHAGAASVDRSGRHLSVSTGSRFTTSIDWWCLESCTPFTLGFGGRTCSLSDVGRLRRRDRRSVLVAGRFVAGNAARSCLSRCCSARSRYAGSGLLISSGHSRSTALRSSSSRSPLSRRWFGLPKRDNRKPRSEAGAGGAARWLASPIELQPGERQPRTAAILTRGNSRKRTIFYRHAGQWIE